MRCPVCKAKNIKNKDSKTGRKRVQKFGKYYRKSDSKMMQRYKCLVCNNTFSPMESHAFYCSQLVTDSFNHANPKDKTFHLQPMNFNDLATGQPIATWVNYFKQLKIPVPNGEPGSSPGGLSLDPHIDIVYRYFSLPAED